MELILLISTAQKLFIAVIALFAVWLLLRFMDNSVNQPFSSTLDRIKNHESIATALYYGLRFVGACLLVGLIF